MAKKYTGIYDEGNATLATETRQAVENVGVATRLFQSDIPVGEWDAVIQEMWATRFYIDNPQIDRRAGPNDLTNKLQGRWRVSSIRKSAGQERPGIVEELRLGWLQAPGTPGEYPKSAGVNDWSGIDSQSRVVKVNEFNPANKALSGINRFYVVTIPGVATSTVKEFCLALAARGNLVKPKFGIQTPILGEWAIRGVSNEDQGDGSSVVMFSLSDASTFSPGSITIQEGWNQSVVHMFYKHLPDYPAAQFPPVNVDAVDSPILDVSGMTQQSPAILYQIAGADFDQQGMWNITVIKRVAKPSMVQFDVMDKDGGYTIQHFYNQTLRWTQTFVSGLSVSASNSVHPQRNEFNLYDGTLTSRDDVGGGGSYNRYYNAGFFEEDIEEFRWDHGGHYIQETWRITCKYRFGSNVTTGLTDFHNGNQAPSGGTVVFTDTAGPPLMRYSYFHEIGGDKYRFKRTVKARLKTTDRTSLYSTSAVGNLVDISPAP